jgi:hypothetical protein
MDGVVLDDLNEAERSLRHASAQGAWLDLRAGTPAEDDPAQSGSWGAARTIRAEVIRALLLGADEAQAGSSPAIRLRGARIVGRLDLMGATVDYPLVCEWCSFDDELRLVEATMKTVRIVSSRLPGFNGARLRLDGILNFSATTVSNGIRLDRAKIVGEVSLRSATVGRNPFGVAVAADGLNVDGNLELNAGFTAAGSVLLRGMRITGSVDLTDATLTGDQDALNADSAVIEGRFSADRLNATGEVQLRHAHVAASLRLSGARLDHSAATALGGGGLTVGGGVWCTDGFIAKGEIRLVGAQLAANLSMNGATLDNQKGPALNLDRASIGAIDGSDLNVSAGGISLVSTSVGSGLLLENARLEADSRTGQCLLIESAIFAGPLRFLRLRTHGETRIRNSRIGGRVLFNEAALENPGGVALRFTRNEVDSDVVCREMTGIGEVRFAHTQIAQHLDLGEGVLSNTGGVALDARGLQAGRLSLLPSQNIRGQVILEHARIGLLRDNPDRWPRPLYANGLTYDALEPRLAASERLRWLANDRNEYQPQPYEQLAAFYLRSGHSADARSVLYAKERRQRQDKAFLGKTWSILQDITVGFGYRPGRAATWLFALLTVGSLVYAMFPPPPLKIGEAPHFNPVIYTLDLLLPIVDLGQQTAYNPAGTAQWFSYGLIAAGWVLATTIAAGAARALGR